jgi:hypothetical protein
MACGSCGKARQVIGAGQAQQIVSEAKYTVRAPDGSSKTFDTYIDAATYRRQVNGQLTTHT